MIRTITGDFDSARFEVELVPHRSIGKRGAMAAMGFTALLLTASTVAIAAATGGQAIPYILPPAAITWFGLTAAFIMNARRACERQTLKMDEQGLTITHVNPDWENPAVTTIRHPPLARLEDHRYLGMDKLVLKVQSQRTPLGWFLPPSEAKELKTGLKSALRNWTQDPAPHI